MKKEIFRIRLFQLFWAIIYRSFKRTFTSYTVLIIYFIQPFFWLFTLGISFNRILTPSVLHSSFLTYLGTGLVVLFSLNLPIFNSFTSLIDFNSSIIKFFRLTGYNLEAYYVLSNVLIYTAISVINFATIISISSILGDEGLLFSLSSILGTFILILIITTISYCLGIIIYSKINVASGASYLISLIITVLMVFSGIYYPIQYLPEYERIIVFISPYSQAISLARYYLIGYKASELDSLWFYSFNPQTQVVLSFLYIIPIATVLFLYSIKVLRKSKSMMEGIYR
ncbi:MULTISPECIES: ABC transporter permease [Acidianus]|uniref:Membrane protein n=1 Tax=Candidatus Acidianus copahuensis TaxID=1160895 RepID=A0A031LWL4_9CREN|nr:MULTISPECIES: ABC transporter permease [Acidianus]EZQ11533.1 membrane protein [Candidatus Acidianus copahuensis]NON62068.1 ABC transporter permease [Acidianus sp. RZ1]